MNEFWRNLSTSQRVGLLLGVGLIIALGLFSYSHLTQQAFKPLLGEMREDDLQEATQKLTDLKVEHRLSADGTSILVPEEQIQDARLKLMGAGMPGKGSAGFELFDNADYGMTEFAQKINYQRALQGELSRTIMTLSEVKYARVHLVLPDASLFKRQKNDPKASVTLFLKPEQTLSVVQIEGIQKLVAASVDGLQTAAVTVLDHQGVVLSKSGTDDASIIPERLEQKRALETHYKVKIDAILKQVFGDAPVVAQVDVALNFDRIETRKESVLPVDGNAKGALHKQSSTRKNEKADPSQGGRSSSVNETTDSEYVYGREIENTIKATGSIDKLTVSVLVPKETSKEQLSFLRNLITTAIGLNSKRGDSIEIAPIAEEFSLQALNSSEVAAAAAVDAAKKQVADQAAVSTTPAAESASPVDSLAFPDRSENLLWIGVAVVLILILVFFVSRGNNAGKRLTQEEREAALKDIRNWINAAE